MVKTRKGDIVGSGAGRASEADVYTVDEFCDRHRISRASFYNYLRTGDGPRIMKVCGRTLVSREAAAEWRRLMETDSLDRTA